MAKTTLATIKSFIKKNQESLYVKTLSDFNGMEDCVASVKDNFKPISADEALGTNGVWIVGDSRDYFSDYEDDTYTGFRVSNCCGAGVIAKRKKELLTAGNAAKASTVSCITNPEWGVKKFSYNEQYLNEGKYASTVGTGSNSTVLFESEYKFWQIESYK